MGSGVVDGSDEGALSVVRSEFSVGIGETPSLTDATIAAFLGRTGGEFAVSHGNVRTTVRTKIA